jgi:hypothetical protein
LLDRSQLNILKFDKSGAIIEEKNIAKFDSLNVDGTRLLQMNNKYYILALARTPTNDCTFGKFFVLTLDKDFNIINQITTEYHGEYVFQIFADVIKNRIVAGVSLKTCNDNLAYTEFYKIDESGSILNKTRYQVSFDGFQPFSICESLDQTGYIATGWVNYKLDSNFNLIKYDQDGFFNLLNSNACTVLRWDESQYLFSYSTNDYGGSYGLRFLDKDLKTLKDKSIEIEYGVPILPIGTSISYLNKNEIFLSSYILKGPFGKYSIPPAVVKVDSNFNVIWDKIYFSDRVTTILSSKATCDGGLILMGKMESLGYPKISSIYDGYILKIDGRGNLTNNKTFINGLPNLTIHTNPSGNIKFIVEGEIAENLSLTMSDINGKTLFRKLELKSDESIDLSFLPFGTYFYFVCNKNEVIKTGKWVKWN